VFDWIVRVVSDSGYLGIIALMLAENVFPPIPSELIMPLAGFVIPPELFEDNRGRAAATAEPPRDWRIGALFLALWAIAAAFVLRWLLAFLAGG
jgi:hypothetical protein